MPTNFPSLRNRPPLSRSLPTASFADVVKSMLPHIGIEAPAGPASDAYTLRFPREPVLYVLCGHGETTLIAACEAGNLPQAALPSMLSSLLALNQQDAGETIGVVGLDVPSGTIVVSSRHRLAGMDGTQFKAMVDAVRRKTGEVRQILAGTAVAAPRSRARRLPGM